MYLSFDLKISDMFYSNEIYNYLESGKKLYNEHKKKAKKKLKEFIYENGHIDGSSMKDNWFQMEKVDIFISHSHDDIDKVKAFAGWLHDEFGIIAFIDSCVWGYCDELIKDIDDEYCKNKDEDTYNYRLRNYTTSHVHMMLSTALSEMIKRTECMMFYNTPNAVSLAEDVKRIKSEKKQVALSPWIYHELAMTSLIGIDKPDRYTDSYEFVLEHKNYAERKINIEHDIEEYLKNMIAIEENDLILWKNEYMDTQNNVDKNVHPLDVLYLLQFKKIAKNN